MRKLFLKVPFLFAFLLISPIFVYAQVKPPGPTGTQIVIGTTPIPNGINGECLTVNGTVVGQSTCGGGGGAGTVTSVATACGLTGGPITTTGTISGAPQPRAVSITSDTILAADCGGFVTYSNAASIAVTLPQATGSFTTGFFTTIINEGVGVVTITPTTSLMDGQVSLTLSQFSSIDVFSDGTNYFTMRGRATTASVVDFQIFTTSGTWTRPSGNFAEVVAYGCGGGGQGGGGATTVSGTASSGGAGGGGGDCHWKTWTAATAGASRAVGIGAGGSTLGQGSTTAGGANGTNGQAGGNTTLGALETWFGGGPGAGGQASATISIGGAGGSKWNVGINSTTTTRGCPNNGGGSGGAATSQAGDCGGGGGGSTIAGAATAGAYSGNGGPGGGSGGGVTTAPAGVTAAGGSGGGSMGCLTVPVGGGIGANGNTAAAADTTYHPGCGGAGGGGQLGQTGTPGDGSSGTAAAGGGGGGSVCSSGGACTAQNGGQGGNGGNGFLLVITR